MKLDLCETIQKTQDRLFSIESFKLASQGTPKTIMNEATMDFGH